MKYKILAAIAALALLSAACNRVNNKAGIQNDRTSQESGQQSTAIPQTGTTTKQNLNGPDYFPPQQAESQANSEMASQPEVVEVQMTASGFSPASITINKGDYIQFANVDSAPHWPISNDYSGFDAKASVASGKYYRFEFNNAGTFSYYDYLNSTEKGIVIVK